MRAVRQHGQIRRMRDVPDGGHWQTRVSRAPLGRAPASIIDQLKGIRCPSPTWISGSTIYSCADAIATVLEDYLLEKKQGITTEDKSLTADNLLNHCPQCPECGSMVSFAEGCVVCSSCGYSKCG